MLVVALAEIRFGSDKTRQWPAFLLFAGLMFAFVVLFYFLVRNYQYKAVVHVETGQDMAEQDMELTDVEIVEDTDFD